MEKNELDTTAKIQKRDGIYIVLLALIVFSFLLILEITEPHYFLHDANAFSFLPVYSYDYHALIEKGELPLINFHEYLGQTHLSQGLTAVLYPPVYIGGFLSKLLFGNIYYTVDILVFMHLIFSVILMFLLLKKLDIPSLMSFLCSLAWVSFPFIVFTPKSWAFVSFAALFIPLNFIVAMSFLKSPSYKKSILLAISKMFFFFSGNVQLLYSLFIFEILFIIINLAPFSMEKLKKTIPAYIASIFFFFLLAAPLFLPMWTAKNNSALRSNIGLGHFLHFKVSLPHFVFSQLFRFTEYEINCSDSQIYFIGPFLFLILFIMIIRIPIKKIIDDKVILSGVILAALAFMLSSIFLIFFHKIIPMLNFFREHFKTFIFLLFFFIIAVARACRLLAPEGERSYMNYLLYFLLAISVITNITLIFTTKHKVFSHFRYFEMPSDYLDFFHKRDKSRIFTYWLPNYKLPDKLRPDNISYNVQKYFGLNFPTLYDVYHFKGANTLTSVINNKLTLSSNDIEMENVKASYEKRLDDKILNHLSEWGVKYFVTSNTRLHKIRTVQFDSLKKVYEDNDTLVFENSCALPVVYDRLSKKEVPFEWGINKITVFPDNKEKSDIIVSIASIEGYRYYFDGKEAGTVKSGFCPVKINVPPGVKKVEIIYHDKMFNTGVLLFVSFWIFAIIVLIYERKA